MAGAICEACQQPMLSADGCTFTRVIYAGEESMPRVAYGSEGEDWGAEGGVRCHDCATLPSHQHHPGCDVERCPRCDLQLISCDCEVIGWGP